MPRNPRNPRLVQIDLLRTDGGTQARAQMTEDAVAEYAEAFEAGHAFPPIAVVDDGTTLWLADGFHRVEASRRLGQERILATVTTGTMVDAVLIAAGSNASHGVRRTNADKKRAVAMVLGLPGYQDKSDREIARLCAVTHPFVASCRRPAEVEVDETDEDNVEGDNAETADEAPAMSAAQDALGELRNALRAAKRMALELADGPHGVFLNRDAIGSDLANAIAAVEGATPARECPVCHGSGCRTCRNVGWISRLVNDHALPSDVEGVR
jgi:uncharacterized ParB-like nuclease family protein